ncbi:WecB/TagA/CpsF family glycosyltransferase [Planotetraspora sp. A-T 1434]|uniref:WecB/TagA/CpsF family glycosyltransferase n=1 Tax=Planotetraspora sp. A-T 1434 TaxID=2979219 RepID=UPI0021BE842C|nr:WecB/TagA/CpsF family glycosyltransferase [Planotetraspora sp. A-T 1434]MCT9931987.1 WecB/TagA/CpsF family glycosyltransferase [Planotetraspora sp. A-T 1434]
MSAPPRADAVVFGIRIDPLTGDGAVERCVAAVEARSLLSIGVVNAAKLVHMRTDPGLRRSVAQCDMILADGQAVVWASRLLGHPLPERVAGIDLFTSLLAESERRGHRVFFLGATREVLGDMLAEIRRRHPALVVAGARDGYFSDDEARSVAEEIRAAGTDMLFLGMSSPKKEIFVETWGEHTGACVVHGVGGSFDVLAGVVKRAPVAWQKAGLEWLYRLLQEPRRLGPRYLATNGAFVRMTALERLKGGRPAVPPPARTELDVSVIVVTYRSAGYVTGCLKAVDRALEELSGAGLTGELVVVDNASGDDTVEVAREASPGARIVAREDNDGFAGGCHAGARVARGRHLLFVNPDAELDPGAVAALLDAARRNPRAGIIGGRCVTESGESDPRSWWGRPTLWSALCFGLGLTTVFPGHRLLDPETPRPWTGDVAEEFGVPIVTGAMMLVDRHAWDELGGLDRAFFMYGEDADLCLRAARIGYRPMVTAAASFVHPGGLSSSSLRKQVMLHTGKVTLIRRHFPPGTRWAGVLLLKAGVLLRAVASRWMSPPDAERQGRPTSQRDDWRALWGARSRWSRGWPPRSSS